MQTKRDSDVVFFWKGSAGTGIEALTKSYCLVHLSFIFVFQKTGNNRDLVRKGDERDVRTYFLTVTYLWCFSVALGIPHGLVFCAVCVFLLCDSMKDRA